MAGFHRGAALVFLAFNAVSHCSTDGNQPISNVPGAPTSTSLFQHRDAFDRPVTATCIRKRHYGHFIATVELFTGIFSDVADDRIDLCAVLAAECPIAFADYPDHFNP